MPDLSSMKTQYFDYCATTPCSPEVIEAMSVYWNIDFGNPSSTHLYGRIAKKAVDKARDQVASLVNCSPAEIVFTSGATESNNLLFLGLLLDQQEKRRKIVVSSIEHKSVLEPAKFLAKRGFELVFIPVSSQGVVDLSEASRLIDSNTALVSVHLANNEIGTIQPVKELAEIAHGVGANFHTDAAQALGKIPVNLQDIGSDFASFSAHKVYGPKGIGALYVKGGPRNWKWELPFHGGGQENGLRPGTQNVPAIVGFGEACSATSINLKKNIEYLNMLRYKFELHLKSNSIFHIHSSEKARIAGVSCIFHNTIPADFIIDNISLIALSRASACTAGTITSSHVITALGYSSNIADCTLRVSFGINTSIEDVFYLNKQLLKAIDNIQAHKVLGDRRC